MRKLVWIALLGIAVASCQRMRPAQPIPAEWQGTTVYTCCNIHYEHPEVTDANYLVGALLPFGTPAQVQKMTSNSVTFRTGATDMTVIQSYGTAQESAQQYFNKILVPNDPHAVFDTYPTDVQTAIQNGRVEVGMTKPQAIMSLGYPPTHRTASTDLNTWTYWYNRWVTYQVMFGDNGKVVNLVGNAPTSNQPIVEPTPTPKPAAARPARKGKTK